MTCFLVGEIVIYSINSLNPTKSLIKEALIVNAVFYQTSCWVANGIYLNEHQLSCAKNSALPLSPRSHCSTRAGELKVQS